MIVLYSLLGIREFGQQQFKGNYLSVSRAKESFLDRLKREREQQDRIGGGNSIGRRLIEISMKSNSELEEIPQLPQIKKDVSSDESSSEESEEEVVVKPPIKRTTFDSSSFKKKEEPKVLDRAALDDMKRQQSLQKLKDMHREQKNAIRNALLAIDTTVSRNNKIVFEKPEPIVKSVEEKKQPILFDSDEETEEVKEESFKIKKQFEGKKGEKLFELQTKFHNDSRFKMDEKFADDTDEFVDSRKKYAREELKERKKLRKEMANWDQNEIKEERDHQLSILESITGQSTGVTNHIQQKQPQKGMLRFDPSKKSHQKYLDVVKGDEDVEENIVNDDEDESKTEENVGEDRYFEVSDNLADAFKSNNENNSKPFSIFGMLGINHNEDDKNDEEHDEKQEEVVETKTKLTTKIQAFQLNQARFKYDSSDTDEEAEKEKSTKKMKKEPQKKSKDGKYSKSGVWRSNFFVCDGDKRLKEAFAFLKRSDFIEPEALQEKRKKLKKVIKTQIRKARHDKEKSSKKRKV